MALVELGESVSEDGEKTPPAPASDRPAVIWPPSAPFTATVNGVDDVPGATVCEDGASVRAVAAAVTTTAALAGVKPLALAVIVVVPEDAPAGGMYVKLAVGAPGVNVRLDGEKLPPAPPLDSETAFEPESAPFAATVKGPDAVPGDAPRLDGDNDSAVAALATMVTVAAPEIAFPVRAADEAVIVTDDPTVALGAV